MKLKLANLFIKLYKFKFNFISTINLNFGFIYYSTGIDQLELKLAKINLTFQIFKLLHKLNKPEVQKLSNCWKLTFDDFYVIVLRVIHI